MSEVHRPRSLAELLELAGRLPGRKYYLAGGTDLGVQRHAGTLPAAHTIALRDVPELGRVSEDRNLIRIGATTTIEAILASELMRERLPLLTEALEPFASPQIRSMATIGGNICNGSPTADTVPPLLVMDAEVELLAAEGSRRLPLASFFTGYKRNVLRDGEVLGAVLVRGGGLDGFETMTRKVGARDAMAIAKLSVAMVVRRAPQGGIRGARIAVGSLTEYPRRLHRTEALLCVPPSPSASRLEEVLRSEITPISDFRSDAAYRERVCLNLVLGFLRLEP